MRKVCIIITTLLACLLVGCANPVEDGVKQLEEKKYEKAIESFEKAIEKEKDVAEAYKGIGIAYFEQKDYEKAQEAFESSLQESGEGTPELYEFLVVCNMEAEDYDGALNYLRLGIANEDADPKLLQEMRFNEIVVYEKLLDFDTAKAKMKSYIADYPDDEAAKKEAEFLETR